MLYLAALFISIFLLWRVLSKIDIELLLSRIMKADFSWVFAAVIISLISHLSRAARWNILMEPLGFRPSLFKTFLAVMVGYFANIFLPRAGEVARCGILTKIDKVQLNSAFGTVVAERAFDFLCLITLISLSLILEFNRFTTLFSEYVLKASPEEKLPLYFNPLFIGSIFLLTGLIILFLFRKKITSSAFFFKIREFLKGVLEGVMSFRKISRKKEFIFHTIFIWVCYYFMTYLMFFSLAETKMLGPLAGLVILILGGLGMSAPSTGGIGTFHELVGGGLKLFYNLKYDDGIAYAFVVHTSQFFSILIVGGLSLLICLFLTRRLNNDLR